MINIPSIGSHIIDWTHENPAHTVGMDSTAFAAAVTYPGKVRQPKFPSRDNELKNKTKKCCGISLWQAVPSDSPVCLADFWGNSHCMQSAWFCFLAWLETDRVSSPLEQEEERKQSQAYIEVWTYCCCCVCVWVHAFVFVVFINVVTKDGFWHWQSKVQWQWSMNGFFDALVKEGWYLFWFFIVAVKQEWVSWGIHLWPLAVAFFLLSSFVCLFFWSFFLLLFLYCFVFFCLFLLFWEGYFWCSLAFHERLQCTTCPSRLPFSPWLCTKSPPTSPPPPPY